MADERRVEIGFEGGQVVTMRLDPDQLKKLREGVEDGAGWRDLETDDGTFALDLSKVVFVRAAATTHNVGFTGA